MLATPVGGHAFCRPCFRSRVLRVARRATLIRAAWPPRIVVGLRRRRSLLLGCPRQPAQFQRMSAMLLKVAVDHACFAPISRLLHPACARRPLVLTVPEQGLTYS